MTDYATVDFSASRAAAEGFYGSAPVEPQAGTVNHLAPGDRLGFMDGAEGTRAAWREFAEPQAGTVHHMAPGEPVSFTLARFARSPEEVVARAAERAAIIAERAESAATFADLAEKFRADAEADAPGNRILFSPAEAVAFAMVEHNEALRLSDLADDEVRAAEERSRAADTRRMNTMRALNAAFQALYQARDLAERDAPAAGA